MCVIVYKKNIKLNKEDYYNMWYNNPDGAGFAVILNEKVYYEKGFTDEEIFWERIQKFMQQDLILHFRIHTGQPDIHYTHPFPLSKFSKVFLKLQGTADEVLFHNGIIQSFNDDEKLSDTAILVKILAQVDKETKEILLNTLSLDNRFLLLSSSGVKLYGDWKEYKGLKVSNLRFKPQKITKIDWDEIDKILYNYEKRL